VWLLAKDAKVAEVQPYPVTTSNKMPIIQSHHVSALQAVNRAERDSLHAVQPVGRARRRAAMALSSPARPPAD
jgi:hypothetical protein